MSENEIYFLKKKLSYYKEIEEYLLQRMIEIANTNSFGVVSGGDEVDSFLYENKKVDAIKIIRDRSPLRLRDAKKIVDERAIYLGLAECK